MTSPPPALLTSGGLELSRQTLFGLRFIDADSIDDVVDAAMSLDTAAIGDWLPLLLTPNVDHLVQLESASSSRLVRSTQAAAIVLPDGQPIVWAGRLLGAPLRARLTGSDLFPALWQRLRSAESPVLVVAPSQPVARLLRSENPDATVIVAPMFDPDEPAGVSEFATRCITVARETSPHHVLINIGQPVQQRLALELLDQWPDDRPPLVSCLGASAEMYLHIEPRAPRWLGNLGLEWLYRLAHNPRRLFRRYFVDDVAFLGIVFREWSDRRHPKPAA
jgi:N-acetylglucosaminyldiphosphoundecaprenol N-acetyl-beta-D-mannosaminyltransferase